MSLARCVLRAAKRSIKILLAGLWHATAYPVALLAAGRALLADRGGRYADVAACLAYVPLRWGECLRLHFYRLTVEGVGEGTVFHFGSFCNYRQARLGGNVLVGFFTHLGEITIGTNVVIGSHVQFLSGSHQHSYDDPSKPICEQPGYRERITIGDDCWIGSGAIVMRNVGTRCVVGAGGVVTRDVPPNTVVAGNPARPLKTVPGPGAV